MSPAFTVRAAGPADAHVIADLINELAEYERLAHECAPDADRLRQHLFGPRAYAEVLLAEVAAEPVGFALFFHNYSTFLCKPGMYLEDLFVRPEHRGSGVGKALLRRVVEIAAERGCGRVEWSVLDWNEPAQGFYREAFGAAPVEGWSVWRMTEAEIGRVASTARDDGSDGSHG